MTKYTLPMVKNYICYKPFTKENTIYLVCLRFKSLAWKEMLFLINVYECHYSYSSHFSVQLVDLSVAVGSLYKWI